MFAGQLAQGICSCTDSDCARYFFRNQCAIYEVEKMFHGNLSDSDCNWSDTQPSILLLLELY